LQASYDVHGTSEKLKQSVQRKRKTKKEGKTMAIKDNIRAKMKQIADEINAGGPTPLGNDLRERAQAAILAGQGQNAAWEAYMELFTVPAPPAIHDAQLARLIPTDGTNDGPRQKARAYLVSNAMCAPGTTGTLDTNVTGTLD
jgi:hypothetical protein